MRKAITLMVAVLLAVTAVLMTAAPALATAEEGCTPGYWKNHTTAWVGYTPSQSLEDVFDVPDSLGLDSVTLLQALSFGGGRGVLGASQTLLREAVAGLLNAAHPDIDWATNNPQEVVSTVNSLLASGDRDLIIYWAGIADTYNNAGCPLA